MYVCFMILQHVFIARRGHFDEYPFFDCWALVRWCWMAGFLALFLSCSIRSRVSAV